MENITEFRVIMYKHLHEIPIKTEKINTKIKFTKIGKNTAQWSTYLHYFICYFVNYKNNYNEYISRIIYKFKDKQKNIDNIWISSNKQKQNTANITFKDLHELYYDYISSNYFITGRDYINIYDDMVDKSEYANINLDGLEIIDLNNYDIDYCDFYTFIQANMHLLDMDADNEPYILT